MLGFEKGFWKVFVVLNIVLAMRLQYNCACYNVSRESENCVADELRTKPEIRIDRDLL